MADKDILGRITFSNNGLVRNWETFNGMMEAMGFKFKGVKGEEDGTFDDCDKDVKRGM